MMKYMRKKPNRRVVHLWRESSSRTHKLGTFSTGVEFQGFRDEMAVYTDSSLDAIKRQNYQNKYRNDKITSKRQNSIQEAKRQKRKQTDTQTDMNFIFLDRSYIIKNDQCISLKNQITPLRKVNFQGFIKNWGEGTVLLKYLFMQYSNSDTCQCFTCFQSRTYCSRTVAVE